MKVMKKRVELKKLSNNLKLISAFLIPLLVSGASYSVEIEEVFKQMSELEEPFKLRDPFQAPKFKTKSSKIDNIPQTNGVYSNIPNLYVEDLNQIKITGVLIGTERRAFLKIDEKGATHTVKEGMTLGPNDAEIKAILPGGIILAEKVVNIYGETEYLETVIPISK